MNMLSTIRTISQLIPVADFCWIFDAAPVPYLVLTPDLTIVAVNEAYLRATLTTRPDLLGRNLFEVFPDNPADPAANGVANLKASLARVQQTHVTDVMPVQRYDIPVHRGPDQAFENRFWSSVNSPVLDERGRLVYIIHRVEDVTDLLRLREDLPEAGKNLEALHGRLQHLEVEVLLRSQQQQTLKASLQEAYEALARLNLAKSAFISNVSHELRTPLSLMVGPIEDLLQAQPPLPAEHLASVDLLHRNALRLRKLINMFMEFSRIDAGFGATMFEPVDLAAFTGELASLFRSAAEHAGLRFSVDCPPLPEPVYVDRAMWETIVLNLLSNAFKFTLEGEIEVTLRAVDGSVELVVRDTGSGIAEQDQPHIFERFHRGETSGARTIDGAGIGLALVQEMVAAHGGSIRVRSAVRHGTSITVSLRRGCEHLPAERIVHGRRVGLPSNAAAYLGEVLGWIQSGDTPAANDATPAARILVIEDNADMRGYIGSILGRKYHVEAVATGDEGLAALRRQPPDLVVTDLMLLGIDGIALIRRIRGDRRNATLPIIVLSARATEEARITAIEAGANDYLTKPFHAKELLAHVAGLLAHGELIRREQQLRQESQRAAARLELVLDSIEEGFLLTDWDGRIIFLNNRQATILGHSRQDLLGANLRDICDTAVIEAMNEVIRTAQTANIEHARGSQWWSVRLYPAGEGIAMFCADITARKLALTQLHEVTAKLQLAADIVHLGYWEIDFRTGNARCSTEWRRMMGYTEGEAPISIPAWLDYVHPDDRAPVAALLDRLAVAGELDGEMEYRLRQKGGSYRWIRSRVRVLVGERGRRERMVGTHLDITEEKLAVDRELQAAHLDTLTGLPNRKLLYRTAEHTLAAARRLNRSLAVLFMDLDGFKPINDGFGHEIGDRLLKAVAERIGKAVRAEDLVGRIGGDEFVAVLAEIEDLADVEHVAQHLVRSISRPYLIEGRDLEISTSMGISLFPKDGDSVDRLVQHADWAMYEAKKAGRGRYEFFRPGVGMGSGETDAADLIDRLRQALAAGEFYLVFQPVFDATGTTLVAAEALLRWRQADGRYMSPAAFLPAADSSGLIKPLGDWLLRSAFSQRKEWLSQGLPDLGMAVNISAAQFRQRGFGELVAAAIGESGMDQGRVSLEVAERTVMGNEEQSIRILGELRELGVGVAIGGFGTGHSNIRHLSRLPIDKLKVDRSFLGSGNDEVAAVDAIVALGRSLHKDIVAEGIESEAGLAIARNCGCHYVQGFHLGRPMPAAEFTAWLAQRH